MANFSLILDIDEFGIKALIIKETIKGVVIEESCQVATEDLVVSEQTEKKDESTLFFQHLKKISEKINLKVCSTAILFIPSSIISFRDITLPFKSKKKIRQVLDYELEFMLPLNNANYLSDFIITDISLSDNQNFIFSASVLEQLVENHFISLSHFGIRPELITIKGYVKASWLSEKEELSKILFIDIQENEKTLSFVINKKVVFLRSFNLSDSGKELVNNIFNTFLSFKQKTRINLLFDKIIVTSDKDTNRDMLDIFEDKFQCPIEYAVIEEDLLSFLLKEKKNLLNLCQSQYKSDSFFKKNIKQIFTTTAIAIFLLLLSLFSIHMDIASLEKEDRLYKDSQVVIFKNTFPKQKKADYPYMEMKAKVLSSKSTQSEKDKNILIQKGIRAIDIIFELSDRVPDNVDFVVSRLLYNNNRLIFSGFTDDFNNIDKIKNSLEKSDIFPKVNISKAAADKKDGKVLFKFAIGF